MLRAPEFWYSKNPLSLALLPASWIYDIGRRINNSFTKSEVLPVPVICVGNLTAGGAGKTPVALYIGQLLKEKNVRAFFLSRGYGGKLSGPVLVDTSTHNAHEVGDEPLMLAGTLPTIVSKDRLKGAHFAIKQGAQTIVMDDGLQNNSIAKTVSLVIVNGTLGFGNGLLLPAGPLREPIAEGLSRTDASIVVNGIGEITLPEAAQVFSASTQPIETDSIKGKRVLAFCGIAYPQKFYSTLHNLGARVMDTHSFSDHHPYTRHEIERLKKQAKEKSGTLITTAKDLVRIPAELRDGIEVLNIALNFDDADSFSEFLFARAGL